MADLKISQLTGATTPLAGTEVLPIVQSGATKQVSVANLTAGRTQTSGGIVQGTAGTGYNFTANTPAAGMTSQLLNWYEEGTWTPTFTGWTSAPTTVYNATYTRIGRQVTLSMYAFEGVNNYAAIGGIPFTGSASSVGTGVIANRTDYTSAGTCCVFTSGTAIDSFNVTLTNKYWQLTVTYFV